MYTVIIVGKLELKCEATQVEIDDMRYASCLPVALTVMEATIVSNLGNVTKALHDSKHDMYSKCEFVSKQRLKTRQAPKVCICFKTVKCSKMKLRILKNLRLSINKGLMVKFSVSNRSLDY